MPLVSIQLTREGTEPGIDHVTAAQKAAINTANAYSANGTPMRYIRSTFAPEDGRCMCLFEARSADDVKRLNDEAKLPYLRVVEALDLTP